VPDLSEDEKQILYRDARVTGAYDQIWQNTGKCVFCDLKDKYIVYEENGVALTIAVFAYIDGHMMIVPRRHVRSVKELTPDEWETMRKLMYLAKKMIRETHGIKGMQIVQKDGSVAQSTVEHIHFHCVPFDQPDLSVWNYRQLKNTPVENTQLYKAHADKMQKLAKRFSEKYE
jgi:diadenosine tetraphosphate (Ap4A) HIT family hydrolase